MAPKTQAPPVRSGPIIDPFLIYAREQPVPTLTGTLAAGDAGGASTSFLTWNPTDIPEVPAWASAIDMTFILPVAVVIPGSTTAYISPYAPYSAFLAQMLLAGAPEWPSGMSLVPFWLDEIVTRGGGFDPAGAGPNFLYTGQIPSTIPLWQDAGPAASAVNLSAGSDVVVPGGTIVNALTSPVTKNLKFQFTVRIRLQRKRNLMWGMIPLGDPQNRPQLKVQLAALVGNNPENNLIQDVSAGGITATVGTGGVTCYTTFRAKSLDVLPKGVPELPTPKVGLGLNVTYDNSTSIPNAGSIQYRQWRTAQIFTTMHHLFVNNKQAVDPDYMGLWRNQDRQSARWEYDNAAGQLQDYYSDLFRRYGRYLPKGHFIVDLEGGQVPNLPRETPYMGLMSPDVGYADSAGLVALPNMATAFRLPSATVISSAYVAAYSLGLVRVPY